MKKLDRFTLARLSRISATATDPDYVATVTVTFGGQPQKIEILAPQEEWCTDILSQAIMIAATKATALVNKQAHDIFGEDYREILDEIGVNYHPEVTDEEDWESEKWV
jgi:hypothetical protein